MQQKLTYQISQFANRDIVLNSVRKMHEQQIINKWAVTPDYVVVVTDDAVKVLLIMGAPDKVEEYAPRYYKAQEILW
jgi:hypothetical protein